MVHIVLYGIAPFSVCIENAFDSTYHLNILLSFIGVGVLLFPGNERVRFVTVGFITDLFCD